MTGDEMREKAVYNDMYGAVIDSNSDFLPVPSFGAI